MMTQRSSTMLDRANAESTIYRVAFAAFTYYPDKPTEEPGYTIDEDLAWCLEPLRGQPDDELAQLRDRIRQLITGEDTDRQGFIRELMDRAI